MKLPIISLAILGGQIAAANMAGGTVLDKLTQFQLFYTGFDPRNMGIHPEFLLAGYGPWLVKRFIMPIAKPRIPGAAHLPISLS